MVSERAGRDKNCALFDIWRVAMRVVLLAGGGHASDVLGVIEARNAYISEDSGRRIEVVGILDDNEIDPKRFSHRGIAQIGRISDVNKVDAGHFISCAGFPKGRKYLADIGLNAGLRGLTVIHPLAWLPEDVVVDEGSVILAGVCSSPGVKIGAHAYLSHGSLVGHDTVIGDFSSIMPNVNVCGDATISEGVTLGASSTVLQGVSIGAWSTIGAGALAVKDVPANVVAKGVPAKWDS